MRTFEEFLPHAKAEEIEDELSEYERKELEICQSEDW